MQIWPIFLDDWTSLENKDSQNPSCKDQGFADTNTNTGLNVLTDNNTSQNIPISPTYLRDQEDKAKSEKFCR